MRLSTELLTHMKSFLGSHYLWFALLGFRIFTATPSFASNHVIIIAGKGGTPEYTQRFSEYAQQLHDVLINTQHFSPDQITILAEPGAGLSIATLSNRAENIRDAFSKLANALDQDDFVAVFLFGHGSYDGLWGKFNINGPDLRDLDFAGLMEKLPARTQLFVNTSSASASFIEKLSRKQRIIITATRGPEENYTTVFPRYFIEAFSQVEEADLNKDDRLSILEAFDYARDRVVRFYEDANRLRPEHPLLDDNGDGRGSETPISYSTQPARSSIQPDGALAGQTFLIPTPAGATAARVSSAPASPLERKKIALLAEIEALKARKSEMAAIEYDREIERLFIQLARLNRRLKNSTP